jgi:2-hydroxychromene-2-carboxylate isomerase
MTASIEFYFDFASPYGYLGSMRIDGVAAKHGRIARWRPILLGVLFKHTGMTPNMHQPLRGEYLRHDTARCARELGVPYTFPSVMPMNSVAASRAFYWQEATDAELARRLAAAIYHAHWGEGRDMGSPEAVASVAETLAIDPGALLNGLQQPEVKDRLRRETDTALARGVFGAPFFFVDGEPFWGADRVDQIDRWLTTGGW